MCLLRFCNSERTRPLIGALDFLKYSCGLVIVSGLSFELYDSPTNVVTYYRA
jgi:hypothetical protein